MLKVMARSMKSFCRRWKKSEDGVAAVESALVFPILMTLLLGTFDIGNGILANQKAIRASQVVADLVTREKTITTTGIDEAVEAGELAFVPLDDSSFGVDIVSISFDSNSNPQILWRETRNMAAMADVFDRVAALAAPGTGVVVVTVQYNFAPTFSGMVVNEILMQEIAFAKGRRSAVVNKV